MKLLLRKYLQGDMVIWAVVLLLSLVSAMAVYSSTGTLAYRYQGGNTEYYLLKHFSIILLGWGLMYMIHKVPFKYFSRVAQILIWISIPLLAITLIAGTSRNEASRWLTLPIINLSFQTSDLAKVALIAYLARVLSKKQNDMDDFKEGFLHIVWPVLAVCVLIFPANFSTAAVLFTTSMIVMFIGGVKVKYLSGLIAAAVTGAVMILLLSYVAPLDKVGLGRVETWKKRLETFASNEETPASADATYQTDQAKIAIAKGGPLGVGPGNSSQRNFIPHPYSDFIYAIIIEEFGMVGGMGILFLYLILLFRGLRIVHKGSTTFGALLAFGVCFALVFQALINMAVAVNLFPVTGQPLPLISMGGTSIWFTSIAIGMILSVSKEVSETSEVGMADTNYESNTNLANI